jgi:Recombinase zinc beta ribbon domain
MPPGVARCAGCGVAMILNSGKGGVYRYYACSRATKEGHPDPLRRSIETDQVARLQVVQPSHQLDRDVGHRSKAGDRPKRRPGYTVHKKTPQYAERRNTDHVNVSVSLYPTRPPRRTHGKKSFTSERRFVRRRRCKNLANGSPPHRFCRSL